MEKTKVIVIEGACDGIGKTTQFEKLSSYLKENGHDIATHHFPSYETYQGEPVERYLKGEFGEPSELSPYFVNSLYAVDRAITWYKELKQALEEGKTILLDRYTSSSLIYQSALIEDLEERKRFIDFVIDFEYHKLGIKEPDFVIFLYAPFDLVTKIRQSRKSNAGISNDIHEKNIEFMKKVYENAMFVAEYLSWNMIKCNEGQEMRNIDDIHNEIVRLIKK